MDIFEVQRRTPQQLAALLSTWEASVRATHHFLSPAEIDQIKTYVPQALREVEHLLAAGREPGQMLAFMGITGQRLEMLFLSPEERGHGLGKTLVQYGVGHYGLREVTVNEQNPQAVGFYRHLGLETYQKTEHDEQGGPYPLLYMRLP